MSHACAQPINPVFSQVGGLLLDLAVSTSQLPGSEAVSAVEEGGVQLRNRSGRLGAGVAHSRVLRPSQAFVEYIMRSRDLVSSVSGCRVGCRGRGGREGGRETNGLGLSVCSTSCMCTSKPLCHYNLTPTNTHTRTHTSTTCTRTCAI